jgi:hypothetical protein
MKTGFSRRNLTQRRTSDDWLEPESFPSVLLIPRFTPMLKKPPRYGRSMLLCGRRSSTLGFGSPQCHGRSGAGAGKRY